MDKNEDREEDHINPKVTALQLAVTYRRRAHCFRYRYVLSDALTVIKLRSTKRNVVRREEEKAEILTKRIVIARREGRASR